MQTLLRKLLFTIAVVSFGITPVISNAADVGGIALFGGGIVSGIYFHELGHATVAALNGCSVNEIGFRYTTATCSGNGSSPDTAMENINEKERQIDLGGYAFQGAASEIILQNKGWHENDFALGWMFMGIFNNLSEPIRYYMFDQTSNDLGAYARAGGDPAMPSIIMATHSIYSFYRIFNNKKIMNQMDKTFWGRSQLSKKKNSLVDSIVPIVGKNSVGLRIYF